MRKLADAMPDRLRAHDLVGLAAWMSPNPGIAELRVKSNLSSRIKLIWPVQLRLKKYSASPFTQISGMCLPSCSEEGRWPSSRTLERDAVDADGAEDERI
jgi:hypothetical protein